MTESVHTSELGAPDYPPALVSISSPPATIWYRGTLPPDGVVAIVGTRRPTDLGLRAATAAASSAVRAGLGVVSGLAIGVDTAAHASALSSGGRSWAVLGSGVDIPSPAANLVLASELLATGGGLLAEVAPGTRRSAKLLIARDRLQSGLALAVVVCQGEVGSGVMHTARFALLQGRRLAVVLPPERERHRPEWSGNMALCDPEGCDLDLLGIPRGARQVLEPRRPLADVVIETSAQFSELWAAMSD